MLHYNNTISPPLSEEELESRPLYADKFKMPIEEIPDEVVRFCPLEPIPLSKKDMEWAQEVVKRFNSE